MVMGVITILMEASIKGLFFKESLMALEDLSILMEIIMKDKLSMDEQMVVDFIKIKM